MSTYSKESEKYEHLREALVIETNKNMLIPVDYSIYKKTKAEKDMLKFIKSSLKIKTQ